MNLTCPSEVWTESTILAAGMVLAAVLFLIGRLIALAIIISIDTRKIHQRTKHLS